MDKTACRALAQDLRQQLQLPDNGDADSVNLVLEGVPFTLTCDTEWGGDHVLFVCDFGPVPPGDRARMLERVLETNLYMFGPHAPTFLINPGDGLAAAAGTHRPGAAGCPAMLCAERAPVVPDRVHRGGASAFCALSNLAFSGVRGQCSESRTS